MRRSLAVLLCAALANSAAGELSMGLGRSAATKAASAIDAGRGVERDKAAVAAAAAAAAVGIGELKWAYTGETLYYSSPAIGADGTVYFATSDHYVYYNGYWSQGQKPPAKAYGLYAYTPDGALKWKYSDGTDAPARGSPAIGPDGTIYLVLERLGSSEGATAAELHAVMPNGARRWKLSLFTSYAQTGALTPAIAADGTLYVAGQHLRAIDPNGNVLWTHAGGRYYGTPAIGPDGRIYTVVWTSGGQMSQAVRALTPGGGELWTSPAMGTIPIICSPSLAGDGTVYIGGYDSSVLGGSGGTLFAFTSAGALAWKFNTSDHDVRSSPAVGADGTIYFGTNGHGYVYALNTDGTQQWRYDVQQDGNGGGSDVYSSPAIGADATIYIASEYGWLYAFAPNGMTRWKTDRLLPANGGTNWSSAAIAADGTLYIGKTYGALMAVRTESLGLHAAAQWPKFRYSNGNTSRKP